jgi:5-methylcytosine-specific restriction endonuclease McrBC regulatory subunit McrC
MPRVIRRLEYDEDGIVISERPSEKQITPQIAEDICNLATKFGCTREGEWFSYKRGKSGMVLKPGGWVGTLLAGGKQIEIRPKIEHAGNIEVDLAQLLIGAGYMDHEFRDVMSMANRESIFDLLALGYARKIAKECNRGLSRGYVEVSGNIPTKRGRIDFTKQWLNKAKKQPLLACTYDEHSEDNQLNRILKAGLKAALATVGMPECRRALGNSLKLLDGISDARITPEQAMRFKPERKDARFRPLINLAARFIHNHGKHQDVRSQDDGNGLSGLGSMWSAWALFEAYVYRELKGINPDSKLKLSNKWKIDNQVTGKFMVRSEGAKRGSNYALKPDLIIYENGRPVYICDTKWKYKKLPIKAADEKDVVKVTRKAGTYAVKKSDLYQMFAYSRFYADKNGRTPTIALIYPSTSQAPDATSKLSSKKHGGPLSMLQLVTTLYFNLPENGDNTTQTAVEIYEFPVPLASQLPANTSAVFG